MKCGKNDRALVFLMSHKVNGSMRHCLHFKQNPSFLGYCTCVFFHSCWAHALSEMRSLLLAPDIENPEKVKRSSTTWEIKGRKTNKQKFSEGGHE